MKAGKIPKCHLYESRKHFVLPMEAGNIFVDFLESVALKNGKP